jgi:hypothetical protein
MATINGSFNSLIAGTISGEVGTPGPAGPAGPAGPGVPTGGTTGQILAKIDGTNYNTEWVDQSGAVVWGDITGTLSSQTDLQTALDLKAPLASPALTGVPTAPTAATLTSTTQLATTAFVQQELLSGTANARNLEVYVRNQTGSTLAAGTIVYINGATGNRPTVTPAQANNDANSAQTLGFTKASIANNGFGFVIVRGELENIDTSALTEGVQLYLSPTTPGAWTTTKPSAPQHLVYVGICVRAHPTQGVILVAVQNGYELEELHDVSIGTLANNDLLAYESSTDLWKNKTYSALGLLTSADLSGYATESWVTSGFYPLTGNPSSFLVAADIAGKADLSGATFTGKLNTTVTATTAALNIAPQSTPPTSTVAGDVWIGTNMNYKSFNGTTKSVANTNTANTFTSVQVVNVTSPSPALRITQSGSGNAIEIGTPEANRFVVNQHGKIGIGVAPDATAALNVDGNGIMFGGSGAIVELINTEGAPTPPPGWNASAPDYVIVFQINGVTYRCPAWIDEPPP